MPLFEYKCEDCGAEFEKLVSTSKRDEVGCIKCENPKASRQLSTFAAHSPGGGSASSAAPCGAPAPFT
jgi:putative FmdB family regulatory protein